MLILGALSGKRRESVGSSSSVQRFDWLIPSYVTPTVKRELRTERMEFNIWLCVIVIIVVAILCYLVLNRKIVDVKGKKVLITGSASGIGRMLAGDMAKKVSHLSFLSNVGSDCRDVGHQRFDAR